MKSPLNPKSAGREEITWDFEGTRRHHIRLGLQMTPAERLRWLEETVEEMRQLGARTQEPASVDSSPGASSSQRQQGIQERRTQVVIDL